MHKIIEHTYHFIQSLRCIQRGELIVVAVSGGLDSVVLLDILVHLQHRLGVRLHIIHYNHRLRAESDQDAEFVTSLGQLYGIPVTIGKRTGKAGIRLSEDKSRHLRMAFCVATAQHLKAASIATAHHENDLAETVLMRIIRGTGLAGLRGLSACGDWQGVKVVRPLLELNRSTLQQYLKKQQLNFREDKTNQEFIYLRNRVRHELLVLLEKSYNPQVVSALSSLGKQVEADYDYLYQIALKKFNQVVQQRQGSVIMNKLTLVKMPLSLQRMMIRLALERVCGDLTVFSFDHVQSVLALCDNPQVKKVSLPRGVSVTQNQNSLTFHL